MATAAHRATPDLAGAILDVVLRAFEDESASGYFFADDFAAHAPRFFGHLLDLRLRGGEVWVTTDSDDVTAVAMFNPPGGLTLPAADVRESWREVAQSFPTGVRERFETYHNELGNLEPSARHYYLGVLATDPAYQGRGLARRVLEPAFARADARGWDTYLETADAHNVSIYERLGFQVDNTFDLSGGPRVWWMRRPTARD